MSHNPQCQCKAIAVRVAVLDKLLIKNSQQAEPKSEAVEAYIKTFIKKVKEVCPQAKNKNIALAAAYTAAGHDNMAKIVKTIVQDTEQDCSWIKEETKQDKEPAVEKSSTTEGRIPSEDFKLINEQLTEIFDKSIKAYIVRVPKEKEE